FLIIRPPPGPSVFPYTTLFRSVDLVWRDADAGVGDPIAQRPVLLGDRDLDLAALGELERVARQVHEALGKASGVAVGERNVLLRSEEHTSELQSQSNFVGRLLL